MMAPRYDEAPEVALHSYPEVHHPPSVPEVALYGQQSPSTPLKPEERTISPSFMPVPPLNTGSSTYGYDHQSAYGAVPPSEPSKGARRFCGCSLLVFILSIIIALLSAAVIGLAAGTGVEASRANNAESKLAAMSASATTSVTTSAPTSTATSLSSIDKGCSTDAADVTGTTYSTYWFDKPVFKIYCNSNAPNDPLMSLFVGDFDDCIDACALYSNYIPLHFSNSTSKNATCSGVSFIPIWTNRTTAENGGAPGNCYLKPGPQNQTALEKPNIGGSAVHAAILQN